MWVEAGFGPDAFWHQTPHTFALAMTGVRKRLESEADARITQAWESAAFNAAAQAGKLKPLRHYLRKAGPKQSAKDMLAAFRTLAASGKVRITKI